MGYVLPEDNDTYPDLEACWSDMCQLTRLEGVGAFLLGMPDLSTDGKRLEQLAESDFLLRFFDERVKQLKSLSDATDWLKELVLCVFLDCYKQMEDSPAFAPPRPNIELLKTIFEFYVNNCCLIGESNEETLYQLAQGYGPECGLDSRLCKEVRYLAKGIDGIDRTDWEVGPRIFRELTDNALLHRYRSRKPWKLNALLAYCEKKGYFPHECGLFKTWLHIPKAKKLFAQEIGL